MVTTATTPPYQCLAASQTQSPSLLSLSDPLPGRCRSNGVCGTAEVSGSARLRRRRTPPYAAPGTFAGVEGWERVLYTQKKKKNP
jgi:hypothetical protein